MTTSATAREALIAEAIGDLGRLLDRADAMSPVIGESTQALTEASAQLVRRLAAFEAQIAGLTENAKIQTVRHIAARTDEATKRSVDAQTRAMAEAAQSIFKAEVGPALQGLSMPLQRMMRRVERPWDHWLTHAATAAVASAVTWVLAADLLPR